MDRFLAVLRVPTLVRCSKKSTSIRDWTPWIVLKTSVTEICNYVSINYVNILLTSIYSEIAKKTKETQDYVDYMFIAIFNWLVRQENISEYRLSKLDKREPATEFLGEFSIVNYAQRSEDIAKPNKSESMDVGA